MMKRKASALRMSVMSGAMIMALQCKVLSTVEPEGNTTGTDSNVSGPASSAVTATFAGQSPQKTPDATISPGGSNPEFPPVEEAPLPEPAAPATPALSGTANLGDAGMDSHANDLFAPPTDASAKSSGLLAGWRGHIMPHFHLAGYYDDNIFIQNTGRQSDFVTLALVGLRTGLGETPPPLQDIRERRDVPLLLQEASDSNLNFLFADYTIGAVIFADHGSEDTLDQDGQISGLWNFSKLSLGFDGHYQRLLTSEIDIGNLVRRRVLSGVLTSRYALDDRTSVEADLTGEETRYEGFTTVKDILNEDWLNYRISPKTSVSAGAAFGWMDVDQAATQHYERVQARGVWRYSDKITFEGKFGYEFRQFGSGTPTRGTFVFNAEADYTPFVDTNLQLSGYRNIYGSALLIDEDFIVTGVALSIKQRVLDSFSVDITGGYENYQYIAASDSPTPSRDDNYLFTRTGIAFDVSKWCNAEIFYRFQKDNSTRSGSSFSDNQVGLEIDLAF